MLGARRADRLQALAEELIGSGGKALAVTTDVFHCDQVKRLVDTAVEKFGRIDVMINNAGLMPQSPLERLKIEEWDRTIDINIKGLIRADHACPDHAPLSWSGTSNQTVGMESSCEVSPADGAPTS